MDVGFKALVDDCLTNLENIKKIEEAAERYWLKTRWVHSARAKEKRLERIIYNQLTHDVG